VPFIIEIVEIVLDLERGKRVQKSNIINIKLSLGMTLNFGGHALFQSSALLFNHSPQTLWEPKEKDYNCSSGKDSASSWLNNLVVTNLIDCIDGLRSNCCTQPEGKTI
jgi:hypothetical protein